MTNRLFAWIPVAVVTTTMVALGGCGDIEVPPDPSAGCIPGVSQSCACDNGGEGNQTCQPNGTFTLCECPDPQCTSPGIACDDGDACTENDTCTQTLQCAGAGIACDDGNPCTLDECNDSAGGCTSVPNVAAEGQSCNDGDSCTTGDACNGSGECVGEPIVNCEADCGNDEREGTEECDGTDVPVTTCAALGEGFTGGALTCTSECEYDRSACTTCGNGQIEGEEDCDGDNLGGQKCTDVGEGLSGGTLGCADDCSFDLSSCIGCGDGKLNGNEECDGEDFGLGVGQKACQFLAGSNFNNGQLACSDECQLITDDCSNCGDGTVDGPEECDGGLAGNSCLSVGDYHGGTLACGVDCAWDVSACEYCGDGELNGNEECEPALTDGLCHDIDPNYFPDAETGGEIACDPDACTYDYEGCGLCGVAGQPAVDCADYTPPPFVTSIWPVAGVPEGGTFVIIEGANFDGSVSVDLGGSACEKVTVNGDGKQLTCYTTAHSAGKVDVTVTNGDGLSGVLEGGFTFKFTSVLMFITGVGSPTPPDPDNYGVGNENVTHTYTLRNVGSAVSDPVELWIEGPNPGAWRIEEANDGCTGIKLAIDAECSFDVTFLAGEAGASAGPKQAWLQAGTYEGPSGVNQMQGTMSFQWTDIDGIHNKASTSPADTDEAPSGTCTTKGEQVSVLVAEAPLGLQQERFRNPQWDTGCSAGTKAFSSALKIRQCGTTSPVWDSDSSNGPKCFSSSLPDSANIWAGLNMSEPDTCATAFTYVIDRFRCD